MTTSWMAKRWCVVKREEQHDLFVGDPWHTHLVDINLRLDIPVERTLCGDLLPARPVFAELLRSIVPQLCPQCVSHARAQRVAASQAPRANALRGGASAGDCRQIDLDVRHGV
ncbi:hypothetical protein [Halopseudomonas sp.]|uniref:hypothetical protein n=1 Tax=Halopseudomonas sp. TaxID=2901191 RepID=UPI001A5AA357|nr:hypothetical protein [Pseudomonas sp.]